MLKLILPLILLVASIPGSISAVEPDSTTVQTESVQTGKALGELYNAAGEQIISPKPPAPKASVESSPSDEDVSGGRELSVSAYSYCLQGRTASGRYTAPGIVAVDPWVIPLGSKLFIPGYGWGVAADTGGAIQGNKIDVWLPTSSECYQWGVRQVTIKVFPPGS